MNLWEYWEWIAWLGMLAIFITFVASGGSAISHTLTLVFIACLALSTLS